MTHAICKCLPGLLCQSQRIYTSSWCCRFLHLPGSATRIMALTATEGLVPGSDTITLTATSRGARVCIGVERMLLLNAPAQVAKRSQCCPHNDLTACGAAGMRLQPRANRTAV